MSYSPRRFMLSRSAGAVGLIFSGSLACLAGCAGPRFPKIDTTVRFAELRFQRDMAVSSLGASIDSSQEMAKELARLRREKTELDEQLARESEQREALSERLEEAGHDYDSLVQKLESHSGEYDKLKETHERLNKMAQATLEEVTALRQKNENLLREKRRAAQASVAQEQQLSRMRKEIDDLRAELVSRTGDSEAGRTPVATPVTPVRPRPRTEADPTTVAGADNVAPRRADSDPKELAQSFLAVLERRYQKALNGDIAWDPLDITVVSVLGALVFLLILAIYFPLRVRKLKRRVRQYKAYYDQKPSHGASHVQTSASSAETRKRVDAALGAEMRDEPPEDAFTPIFRSSRSEPEPVASAPRAPEAAPQARQAPQHAPQAPAARSEGRVAQQRTSMRGSGGEDAGGRKIIGAWMNEDPAGSPAQGAAPSRQPSRARAPAAATVVVEAQPPTPSDASPPATEDVADGGEVEDRLSKTEILGLSSEERRESGPVGGAREEQELLEELKSIINKKLDRDSS